MKGHVESLNVGSAAAVCLFEAARQRQRGLLRARLLGSTAARALRDRCDRIGQERLRYRNFYRRSRDSAELTRVDVEKSRRARILY